ncbi:MAG: sugar ABC transporter permease [Actinomycetales bacterium]|nr:sugar ABC transporter permease [Actinomycetales bacterium]
MSATAVTNEPAGGTKGRRSPRNANAPKKKASGKNWSGARVRETAWGYLFTSPFFVVFFIFGIIPIIYSVYLSLTSLENPLDENAVFVGLRNFENLWNDPDFWKATRNTFSIWFLSTIPQMALALGLASILRNPRLRFRLLWQTIFLVPNITSGLAIAVVFGQLFGRDYGLINFCLQFLGISHIDWLENTVASHVAIATMITWRWVGYNSLIFLASMNAIDSALYESAALDGANRWQQFRYVTIPGLRNTIIFMVIMGTIGGLQVFAEPLTFGGGQTTGGSSGQFNTVTLYLFRYAKDLFNYGYASAIGIGITFIVLIITALNFLITRRIASEDSK